MLELAGVDGRRPGARRCATAPRWTGSARWWPRRAATSPNRCRSVGIRKPSRYLAAAQWATSTQWRWVWRCGGSARAGAVPGERVQSGAGLRIHRKPGEPVVAGEPLFTLYTDTPQRLAPALAELEGAFEVGDSPPVARPLIIDRLGS